MVHPCSVRVWFLACEFLAGCSSFIGHKEPGWLEIFNLEDRWMSVHCLRGLQS